MSTTASRCYWDQGELVVEFAGTVHRFDGPRGVQALKENAIVLTDPSSESQTVALFDWKDTRRMALIQERISTLHD